MSGQAATVRARIPGLDGLRAFAVAAVLAYHAGDLWQRPPLPGGFLGVDVFFVLSGFLITTILLDAHRDFGGVPLSSFWRRRGTRLLPAALTAIIVTLALIVMFDPSAVASIRGDALAGVLNLANWRFILETQGYFEQLGRPSPFRHLWSLSIEWQFYIVWPLVLAAALTVTSRRTVGAVAMLAAISAPIATGALYAAGADASRLYYGTDTHIGGLLAGAALAFVLPMQPAALRPMLQRALASAGAVAMLALSGVMLFVGIGGAIYGGFAAVSALTIIAIASVVAAPARWHAILNVTPVQWLGTRSYAIYIVHWPVFVYTRPNDVALDGAALLVARLAITFVLAEALHRFVERRFMVNASRIARAPTPWLRRAGALSIAAGTTALIAAVIATDAPPAKPTLVRDPAFAAPRAGDRVVAPRPTVAPAPTATAPAPQPIFVPPAAVVAAPTSAPPPSEPVVPSRSGSSSISSVRPVDPAPATDATPAITDVTVTAIGDSVMLGATPALRAAVARIDIYAEVGIQTSVGVRAIADARESGAIGDVLLVHLGNNGLFTARDLDDVMAAAGDRRVVLVNVSVPRDWEAPNNAMLAANIGRYGNARLADWHAASTGHPDYFGDDGIHVGAKGAAAYVALIAATIQD